VVEDGHRAPVVAVLALTAKGLLGPAPPR